MRWPLRSPVVLGFGKRRRCVSLCGAVVLSLASLAGGQTVQDVVNQVSLSEYRAYLGYPGDLADANNPLPADRRNPLCTHSGDARNNGQSDWTTAQDNLVHFFNSFGLDAAIENTPANYNVVASKIGSVRPNDIYIVGAHYDSVGNPGADDDASGVAGVLEAAGALSRYQFEATVLFIAFDREEDGLLGSKAYAAEANARGDHILGMIELDMIAYNDPGANHDRGYLYGRTDPIKTAVGDALVAYGGLDYTKNDAMDRSDHAPFELNGFPACLLIEAGWGGNPYYHKSSDNVDSASYIDYAYATSMVQGAVGWLAGQAALVPQPPGTSSWHAMAGNWSDPNRWTAGVPDGNTLARIASGGTVTFAQAGGTCARLQVGEGAAQAGTLLLAEGDLICTEARAEVASLGTLNLAGGTLAGEDANRLVDVGNDGLLHVMGGMNVLGDVLSLGKDLLGAIQLDANAHLSVARIVQGSLSIGPGATLTIRGLGPGTGALETLGIDVGHGAVPASQDGTAGAPEPASLVLLTAGGAGVVLARRRRRYTSRQAGASAGIPG